MKSAILIFTVSCGLILAAAGRGACEVPVKAKQDDLIVLFIKVVEETADKQESQLLSEPTLTTQLGRRIGFLVGGQVPIGGAYYDVGHGIDFVPTKISGQTIWVVIESTFTDYVKNKQGELQPLVKRQVTKRKLELGKMVVEDPWEWNLVPKAKTQLHLEYRIERMTWKEYRLADAKAREAAENK